MKGFPKDKSFTEHYIENHKLKISEADELRKVISEGLDWYF